MAKKVSSLNAKLTLNPSGFLAGLDKAKKSSDKFIKNVKKDGEGIGEGISSGMVKAAAAIAAAGLTVNGIISKLEQSFEKISKLSRSGMELNLNPEAIQKYAYIAKKAGLESSEEILKSIGKMPKMLADATEEGSALQQTFASLKLDPSALMGQDGGAAFESIISSLGAVENANERVYLAQQLFGEEARKILPLIGQDFDALAERANSFGLILSGEQVATIDLLRDKWGEFTSTTSALWDELLVGITPIINSMIDNVMEWVDSMGGVKSIVKNIMWGLAAMGDVGSDVFNGLKVGVYAVLTGVMAVSEGMLQSVEWFINKLGEGINYLIKKASDLKESLGGDKIEFRLGKVNLNSKEMGEVKMELATKMSDAYDQIGTQKFSKWVADVTEKTQEQAKAIVKHKEQLIKTTQPFERIATSTTKAAEAIEKLTEKVYRQSLSLERIAQGKGSNATLAQRILAENKRAEDMEARGNFDGAKKIRERTNKLWKNLKVRRVADDGSEIISGIKGMEAESIAYAGKDSIKVASYADGRLTTAKDRMTVPTQSASEDYTKLLYEEFRRFNNRIGIR